jgi:hypothetical protein
MSSGIGVGISPWAEAKRIDFIPYEDIWERDGKWVMGRGLLADVVLHLMRGKGLHVEVNAAGVAQVTLPLPTVLDEITGTRVSVVRAIPEELREIFNRRCQLVLDARRDQVIERLAKFQERVATPLAIAQMNAELSDLETNAIRRDDVQLWQLAALAFGLHPYCMPIAAGMAN